MMLLLRTDGSVWDLPKEPKTGEVARLIGAEVLDCVSLWSGHVMMVDDLGYRKNRPVNEKATQIYHAARGGQTGHQILGDVVIMPDGGVMDEEAD